MPGGLAFRLGGALAGVLMLIGAFLYGRSTGIDHQLAKDAKTFAKVTAALNAGMAAMDVQSGRLAEAQTHHSNETRTIRNDAAPILARPTYAVRCIDADGVQLLDRAAAVANAGLAGAAPNASGGTAAVPPQP